MKRTILTTVLLAVFASACAAPDVRRSTLYAIEGDAQASPVQAFESGDMLYVQLRNPTQPPAPIGQNGPIAYVMRGPYMVLPRIARVTLTYGPYSATVRALNTSALPDDVVSITQPVDALETPRRPHPSAAPFTGRVVPVSPASGDPGGQVVAGVIHVTSPEIEKAQLAARPQQAVIPANPASSATAAARPRQVQHNKPKPSAPVERHWLVSYAKAADPDMWSGRMNVRLIADGTADGAAGAIAAADACRMGGSRCEIVYNGGQRGVLRIDAITPIAAKDVP